ncbi:MAG: hypothetical protein AAGT88_06280 [Dethiobacter sp.]
MSEEKLNVYRQLLPGLLNKLARFVAPKKTKHQMTVMMLYGILMFVFQMPLRRETNKEMTTRSYLKICKPSFRIF